MTDVVDGKRAAPRGVASYVRHQIFTVPNAVTGTRLTACIGITLSNEPALVFCFALWGVASDWVDGRLAKWLKQETDFGRVLDQVTDFLFGASLIYAVYRFEGASVHNIPIAIGIAVFGLGVWHLRTKGLALTSSVLSKRRIAVQFIAAAAILGSHTFVTLEWLRAPAYIALWASLILMLAAYIEYAKHPN